MFATSSAMKVLSSVLRMRLDFKGMPEGGVPGKLVIALDSHQQVKLHTAVDGDLLPVVRAIRLAAELRVPYSQLAAHRSACACQSQLERHPTWGPASAGWLEPCTIKQECRWDLLAHLRCYARCAWSSVWNALRLLREAKQVMPPEVGDVTLEGT